MVSYLVKCRKPLDQPVERVASGRLGRDAAGDDHADRRVRQDSDRLVPDALQGAVLDGRRSERAAGRHGDVALFDDPHADRERDAARRGMIPLKPSKDVDNSGSVSARGEG